MILATLAVVLLEHSGVLERSELHAFDALLRSIPDQGPDERLLIASITEADTARHGYPLDDVTLARILANILKYQPRAVGIDLYRHIEYPPGTALLEAQLRSPQVVGIRYVGTDPAIGQVPASPMLPSERVGFSDLVVDSDGIVRRALIYVGGDPGFFSFALRTVLVGLTPAAIDFRVGDEALYFGDQAIPRLSKFSGGYSQVDNAGYQTVLRYRSRRQPAEVISISDLLEGAVQREQVEGRIVLIGRTEVGLADQFYSPYSAIMEDEYFTMSGVAVHAHIISQLLDVAEGRPGQYSFMSRIGEVGWMLFWTTLAAALAWSIRQPVLLLLSAPLVPLAIAVVGWFAVARLFWPPLVAPGLAAVLGSTIVGISKYLYRSTHDPVTGLPDRNAFLQRIRAAQGASWRDGVIAVAFLDIDRFQVINKAMGHAAGDRLLGMLSSRLQNWLGGSRDLARIGGDQFAVVLRELDRSAVAERIREMRQLLSEPVQLDRRKLSIAVSVGVAYAKKKAPQKPEMLLRDAHTAMYRAKARKEVLLETYSSDMGDQALARLELESELFNAEHDKEFFLVYQPIMHLQTGALIGFEALLRWQSPQRGLVGPEAFIPILEETGMIVPLGEWVLETACRQLAEWRSCNAETALKMHVNLSVRQISEPGLLDAVRQSLERAGLPASALSLEFTESMIMRDIESIHELMTSLKSMGVGLAIDDFGTGYSSLSYLHRFPLDTLKIDKSFVRHLSRISEDRNIVHTIIAIGDQLGMTLVAEGIENKDQADMLYEAGCHFGQGFLYSRPLTYDLAAELVVAKDRARDLRPEP
ncbi:MAG: putative bifunctional diguanylate cyclase/phosphodiesterase [Wenzhouxiangella sp.]